MLKKCLRLAKRNLGLRKKSIGLPFKRIFWKIYRLACGICLYVTSTSVVPLRCSSYADMRHLLNSHQAARLYSQSSLFKLYNVLHVTQDIEEGRAASKSPH
jgi:hypothetical protein